MSVPRSEIAQYDELALDRENWPEKAVRVAPNPDRKSRIKYLFYAEDDVPLCSAKRASWTPDEPKYCGSDIITQSGRCTKHGGNPVSGMAHYKYKDGRHSKNLPSHLAGKYQEAQDDPELFSLKSEVLLIDAKINSLLESS